MKIYVDIDETICNTDSRRDYSKSEPIKTNILAVNKLFEDGHEITYWSARGSGTGINWYDVTKAQFEKWGVKYHYLILGEKPLYDLLIDDKAINVNNIDEIQKYLND